MITSDTLLPYYDDTAYWTSGVLQDFFQQQLQLDHDLLGNFALLDVKFTEQGRQMQQTLSEVYI